MNELSNEEIWERLKKLYALDAEYRGRILTLTITIEHILSEIISIHFCSDEVQRNLLFSLVLTESNIMIGRKSDIFKKLMKLQHPEIIKKYPDLPKKIENAIKFRNKIAHSMLDTSEKIIKKNVKDQIQLISYKNGKKYPISIDKNEYYKRWDNCLTILQLLIKIRKEIEQKLNFKH